MTLLDIMDENAKVQSRTIDIATQQLDEAHILVCGELHDRRRVPTYTLEGEVRPPASVHHMRIALKISVTDLAIEAVEVELRTIPHEECAKLKHSLQKIKGLRLAPGFSAEVRKRIGGRKGCIHLTTLLLAIAPAALQGYWTHNDLKPEPRRISRELMQNYLIDTCHVWRREGPLAKEIAKAAGIVDPN